MNRHPGVADAFSLLLASSVAVRLAPGNADPKNVLTGLAAFASFNNVKPGTWRHITPADLPKPFATPSSSNGARVVSRPADAWPMAPAGFKVELFASDLHNPRLIRTAPNGDMFLAETSAGNIKIFRGMTADGKAKNVSVFATGLRHPFGIAFYPPGSNPQWLYIGNTDSVVRFPLQGWRPEGHWLSGNDRPRDSYRRSLDPRCGVLQRWKENVRLRSARESNVDDPDTTPAEFHRANILEYTPEGKFVKVYGGGDSRSGRYRSQPDHGRIVVLGE